MNKRTQMCVLAALSITLTVGAAPFQNLDFESGTFVPYPGGLPVQMYFDQAFPGWRGYIGGAREPTAFSNAICIAACPQFVLLDEFSRPQPIEGSLTAFLHGGLRQGEPVGVSMAQTGLVPSDAQSLSFSAQFYGGPFEVALSGQPLSLVPLLATPDYIVFGADITAWAGQEAELRFTAFAGENPALTGGGRLFLDSVEFSTTPIPEPSTLALFAVAGVLGWAHWRRKTR
jgi:hypothetical protein